MKPPETEEELVEWILRQRVRRGKVDVDIQLARGDLQAGHVIRIPSLQGWRWAINGRLPYPRALCDFCGAFVAVGTRRPVYMARIRYHVAQCALAWWAQQPPDEND